MSCAGAYQEGKPYREGVSPFEKENEMELVPSGVLSRNTSILNVWQVQNIRGNVGEGAGLNWSSRSIAPDSSLGTSSAFIIT